MLTKQRQKRKRRVRAKVLGTAERPRLSVFRSGRFIYAQLIDDLKGVTLASASDRNMKVKGTKTERAVLVGEEIAKLAAAKGIREVVFDRGGYKFHGRVAGVADGAKKGGLKI